MGRVQIAPIIARFRRPHPHSRRDHLTSSCGLFAEGARMGTTEKDLPDYSGQSWGPRCFFFSPTPHNSKPSSSASFGLKSKDTFSSGEAPARQPFAEASLKNAVKIVHVFKECSFIFNWAAPSFFFVSLIFLAANFFFLLNLFTAGVHESFRG